MSRRPLISAIVLAAALGVVAVGCGSSSDSSASDSVPVQTAGATPSTGPTSTSNAGPTAASVKVVPSSLGPIVVDSDGFTLYVFTPDTGSTSTCTGGCAVTWPPLAGPATAGEGVTAALAVTTRPDGTQQVTLAGHPLYRYAADSTAGDVNGQGVGGKWYVVDGSGKAVSEPAAAPSSQY